MRTLAAALSLLALAAGADARSPSGEVAFVQRGRLVVLYLATGQQRVVQEHVTGPVHLAARGRYASAGGTVAGGPRFPAADLVWAPTGDRLAYVTRRGGVVVWSPTAGSRTVVPAGWGAQGVAWGPRGQLAIGRAVCAGRCGLPVDTAVWVWRGESLRRVVRVPDRGRPLPLGWNGGRVLWWDWPNSGSIAADGVALYAGARRIAGALMYPDYVDSCGSHLAIAAGGDRYAMHGKRILFDGRDVSRDPSRSWVSPSCSPGGLLVAAASANAVPQRLGREHRAIWQLLPERGQLTRPPPGWTDEYPRLLGDGSVLFIRTRLTSRRVAGAWVATLRGRLMIVAASRERQLATLLYRAGEAESLPSYYGHYDWPRLVAVEP